MGTLEGRVAVVTGAAHGLGRAHALALASEGAAVVVNDLGPDAAGHDGAAEVASTIVESGGRALAVHADVSNWQAAKHLIDAAVDTFGDLHALVNNAGFLRDRMLVNQSEQDWDSIVSVHLRGHFCPLRWAASYWRDRAKAGAPVEAAVVNTSSSSGLFGNPGQANYSAAKAGIVGLTLVAARELQSRGVRVNAIAPVARTRLTETTPGLAELIGPPLDPGEFDPWDPANVSPVVTYLVSPRCHLTGQVLGVQGGTVSLFGGWTAQQTFERADRWTVEDLAMTLADVPGGPPEMPTL